MSNISTHVPVTLIYARADEIYIENDGKRDSLGFVYVPLRATYDRKRCREEYLLPIGLILTCYDGEKVVRLQVTTDLGYDGNISHKTIKANGAIRELPN